MEGGTACSPQQDETPKLINEWGKYIENRDMIRIRKEERVIQHLEANDPAIRSVSVSIEVRSHALQSTY